MSRVIKLLLSTPGMLHLVSAECKGVGVMYNPELWPEGTLVRRYYESRKTAASTNAVPSTGGTLSLGADISTSK